MNLHADLVAISNQEFWWAALVNTLEGNVDYELRKLSASSGTTAQVQKH